MPKDNKYNNDLGYTPDENFYNDLSPQRQNRTRKGMITTLIVALVLFIIMIGLFLASLQIAYDKYSDETSNCSSIVLIIESDNYSI